MTTRARFLLLLALFPAVATAAAPREAASIPDLEVVLGDIVDRARHVTVLAEPSAFGVITALAAVNPEWEVEVRWTPPGTTSEALDHEPGCSLLVAREPEAWFLLVGNGCTSAMRPVASTAAVVAQFDRMSRLSAVILVADDAAAGLADGLRSETQSTRWRIRRVDPVADWDPLVRDAMDRHDVDCGAWLSLAPTGWWSSATCDGAGEPFTFIEPDEDLTVDLVRPRTPAPSPLPTSVAAPIVVPPAAIEDDLTPELPDTAAPTPAAPEPSAPISDAVATQFELDGVAQPSTVQFDEPRRRRWTGERVGITVYGTAYAGYIGGVSAYLIGEATEAREDEYRGQTIWAGALIGVAVGGISSALLSGARDSDDEAVMLLYGSTALGALYGHQMGRLFVPTSSDGVEERTVAANLGGSLLGMGLSIAFANKARPLDDQAHFLGATALGTIVGTGIGDVAGWDPWDDRPQRAAVEGATALAFSGAAMAWNLSDRPLPSWYALTWYEAVGGFVGGFTAAAAFDSPSSAEITGGLRIGLGAGYASALIIDAIAGPSPRSVAMQSAGLTAGSLLGAGIPLASGSDDPRVTAAAVVGGAIAGDALGAALSPAWGRMGPGNWVTAASLGTWTAFQVVGWSFFGGHLDDATSAAGYGLATAGAGSIAMLAISPHLELTVPEAVMSVSGGGWGTWFGAWGGALGHLDPATHWAVTLGASNAALVGTALAAGLGKGITWRQVAWIDGLTLGGAAAGGLVGAVFLYDTSTWDPVVASVLVGSGAGLAAGFIAAVLSPGKPPTGLASLPRIRRHGSSRTHLRFSLTPEPVLAKDGSPGFLLRLEARETR